MAANYSPWVLYSLLSRRVRGDLNLWTPVALLRRIKDYKIKTSRWLKQFAFWLFIKYEGIVFHPCKLLLLFFFFNKFIYLFLVVLGLRFCARAFSSCGDRGPLFIAVHGPLTVAASRCGAQAPDAQAQQLWLTGPVAPRHVGSSQTRARTRVPCIGRQTLNHCAAREAPIISY